MRCTSCNTPIDDNALVCHSCGEHVAEKRQQEKNSSYESAVKSIVCEKFKSPLFVIITVLMAAVSALFLIDGFIYLGNGHIFFGILKILFGILPLIAAFSGFLGIINKGELKTPSIKGLDWYPTLMEGVTYVPGLLVTVVLGYWAYVFIGLSSSSSSGLPELLKSVYEFVAAISGFEKITLLMMEYVETAEEPIVVSFVCLGIICVFYAICALISISYKRIGKFIETITKINDEGSYSLINQPSDLICFISAAVVALFGIVLAESSTINTISCLMQAAILVLFTFWNKSIHNEEISNQRKLDAERKKLIEIREKTKNVR